MNAPLRRVGIVAMFLVCVLVTNLTYVQFAEGDALRNDPRNHRVQVDEYRKERGLIITAKSPIARSIATDGELRYLRTYPHGSLYAHITGYKSVALGATGIEQVESDILAGTDNRFLVDRVTAMLRGEPLAGGNVLLTLNPKIQSAAYRELGNRRGAAVAIDPRTGALLAVVSTPSYDPNLLSSNDPTAAGQAYDAYLHDPANPLINRAFSETYPPGSTFKVVMSALALERGYTPDTLIPAGSSYTPPQTTVPIHNAVPSICPVAHVTLEDALTESCNTAFAQLGVAFGADAIREEAVKLGFTSGYTTPLSVAPSETGAMADLPAVAQSAIGQRDVRMTPLQGALLAATVANGGVQMQPYLVQALQAPNLTVLDSTQPSERGRPLSADVARNLSSMMVNVVEHGTGTNAQIPGYTVGGKTGTASTVPGTPDHGWFIGFALDKSGQPTVAVAVFLENAGPSGSGDATAIGGEVMRTALGLS